ncbi:CRP-like cAMP-binding protein [Dietzia sp. 2505]|uniref:Crp/Fnr family transcriptional regulator n=1 Tax=Dietzia sp. 2505 TaxID=3156457 RepID=UPI0033960EB6
MTAHGDGSGLAGSALFASLPPRCWAYLADSSRTMEARPRSTVQLAGEPVSRLVVIVAGALHVIREDRSGRQRHVRILGPGRHLGLVEFALGCPARHSVVAAESTTLATVSHDALRAAAAACPVLHDSIRRALAEKVVECEQHLDSLTSEDVSTRLVSYLLSLPATPGQDGRPRVRLPVSQSDLASHLGTTPETLSRRLHELIDSGAVERVARREFVLEHGRLTRC